MKKNIRRSNIFIFIFKDLTEGEFLKMSVFSTHGIEFNLFLINSIISVNTEN